MSNVVPGAQEAQPLHMFGDGHQDFINLYGDAYEAGSVAASNEAEPWLLPPATAPTAIAEADEPGLAEEGLDQRQQWLRRPSSKPLGQPTAQVERSGQCAAPVEVPELLLWR